ncbi:MAG TPA: sulfotransferase domain-containing protein [Verrucomicrobiae bacterium]|jgi:hypothetical protein
MNKPDPKLRTALASFPRSGNTWVRFLLEKAVGELCGSIYKDRIMPRGAEGIAIKTHALDSAEYDRAIYIVRNPLDVIESYFFWKKDVARKEVNWADNVRVATAEWRDHAKHWLAAKCPVHRVRYEDLKARPAQELTGILHWLGYETAPEQINTAVAAGNIENMRELNQELGDKFFRRGEVGKSSSSFSPEELAYVRCELREWIETFGYGDLISAQPA